MRTNVELYYDPVSILDQLSENKSEMSDRELAFVCGLIREYKPNKIVEIGVSAGGSSSVILNCVSMLGLDAEMFSIDRALDYYKDKTKKVGYLIYEVVSALNKKGKKVRHTLYTGSYAVECLEAIGGGIDFLILDTVHGLPGEILDFLACYPLLKQKCVVVLHDLVLNHQVKNRADHSFSFANKILFDTVTANKILDLESGGFPNIGAFITTEATEKSLEDVFSALTITWKYKPENDVINLYRKFYNRYYTKSKLKLFDMAVQMNCASIDQKLLDEQKKREAVLAEIVKLYKQMIDLKTKRIYIYGYGIVGKALHHILEECGIGNGIQHIVSDGQKIGKTDDGERVYHLSEVELELDRDVILIGVNVALQNDICNELHKRGFTKYILLESEIYSYLL